MTTNEIKKEIENAKNNGGFSFELTKLLDPALPFATREEYLKDEGETYFFGVFVEVADNGETSIIADNGSCRPAVYTVEKFLENYGE